MTWKAQLLEDQEKDTQTPINLTNHTYWNLSGDFTEPTIRDHALCLPNCSKYLPLNEVHIPTGEIADVEGTPFDFTKNGSML
jgi:aldose 1-epimerase